MQPTRTGVIDGRRCLVFDEALDAGDNTALLSRLEHGASYRKTEIASQATAHLRHWVHELDLVDLKDSGIERLTRDLVAQNFPDRKLVVTRAYVNVATYGDALQLHTDAPPDSSSVTALYFICDEWKVSWGGELHMYDSTDDAVFAVSPRPRRLCLFEGAIRHAGSAPARTCYKPRYTLAFKLDEALPERVTSARAVFEDLVRKKLAARTTSMPPGSRVRFRLRAPATGAWVIDLGVIGGAILPGETEAAGEIVIAEQDLLDLFNKKIQAPSLRDKVQMLGSVDLILLALQLIL